MIRKVSGGYRVIARSGRNMGTYRSLAEAKHRLAQVEMFKSLAAQNLQRRGRSPLKKLVRKIKSVFGASPRRKGCRIKDLRRFNRAELIAALGLEPEGRSRQQKYAATTAEFKKRIAYGASRADAEARRRLGC